jgi:hypothetical protein
MIERNVEKGIRQLSISELFDLIENSNNSSKVNEAKEEFKRRKLSQEEIDKAKVEYQKYIDYKNKRKEEPLDNAELITLFFFPFFGGSRLYESNSVADDETERYRKYGYQKKLKQAIQTRILGIVFYLLIGIPLLIFILKKLG